jgi:hypothetical protein
VSLPTVLLHPVTVEHSHQPSLVWWIPWAGALVDDARDRIHGRANLTTPSQRPGLDLDEITTLDADLWGGIEAKGEGVIGFPAAAIHSTPRHAAVLDLSVFGPRGQEAFIGPWRLLDELTSRNKVDDFGQ